MEKELPENWIRTHFGSVIKFKNGYAFKSKDLGNEGIPVIRIGNIKDGKIDLSKTLCIKENLIKKDFIINQDDILIAMSGATTGKYGVYKNEQIVLQNQRVGNIRPISSEIISKKFIYHLLGSIKEEIEDLAYGGAQPNISSSKIEAISIPLPPLPEQNRIVAKLDKFFEQLEVINASLDKISNLLKNFRKQVLTQAVTGELTKEWRKDKKINKETGYPKSWNFASIDNLVKSVKTDIRTGPFGSSLKKEEHSTTGVPVWGIESIGENGEFTGKNKIFVNEEKAEQLKSFEVKGGDIIISRSGTVGELCLLPDNVQYGLISTNLMKIVLDKNIINPLYFCWIFKSSPLVIQKLEELCKGSTRLFLTQKILKTLYYPLPPLEEQDEIVIQVNKIFHKTNNLERQYEFLKKKIHNLPQSILHKAFNGELVPQLESDGDARELLEEIKNLKIKT